MKKVEFTSFHLEYFGKHEILDNKLGRRVFISGANATGKSTIKRMFQWVLGTKDENGKEITGIRPHDENGVDIDGLTTVAKIGVSVEGQENTLKRVCFQEKNRQGEYTGKDNLQYFVDDVKKGTKKAYDEFVSSIIPNPVCISANEFFGKDTDIRRKILEDTFSEHSNDVIIDMHPEYEELRPKLRVSDVRELRTALRRKKDGYSEKGHHVDGLVDKREKVIHEIEFTEKQKVDIDVAELELQRNSLNEQIAENKAKQADISKQFEEIDRRTQGIMDLQFELNGLQQKANEGLEKKRREIRTEINNVDFQLKEVLHQIRLNKQDIESAENSIASNTAKILACRQKWTSLNGQLTAEKERVFDDSSLVCSYCGQEYPEDKKEQLKSDFESHKEEEIKRIESEMQAVTEQGNSLKSAIEKGNSEIEQLKATLKGNEDEEINLKESIKGLEKSLEELPDSIDISEREDVKNLKQQISENEAAMQRSDSASEVRQQLQAEYEDLQSQLNEVNNRLSLAQKNIEIDERVEELRKAQMQLSQEIADIERELDLLKRFERKKAELLETDVNKHFELVKFKMFREMQNGELADICSPYVNGTSYDGNLNTSDKLLAGVDICTAFQKHYDVQLPILLDNAESVDDDRIQNVENQLIIFKRADNKELRIEVME